MRTRLLALLILTLVAAGAVVVLARNGDDSETATSMTTGTATPKPPAHQPEPPPVRNQPTPATPPRPLGEQPPVDDLRDRRQLEAFIAQRPELAPWKEEIWYVAHYSYSNVSARGLAGMMWCIGFRIPACDRASDYRELRGFGGRPS